MHAPNGGELFVEFDRHVPMEIQIVYGAYCHSHKLSKMDLNLFKNWVQLCHGVSKRVSFSINT